MAASAKKNKLIKLKPYQKIEHSNFNQKINFLIEDLDFQNVSFQEGKFTYTFTNCVFNELEIENFELIAFNEISIIFIDCYFNNFNIKNITTSNISIHIISSILGGKFDAKLLKNVSLNNCIVNNNFFLMNLLKVNISYTEENIFPLRWRNLFRKLEKDFEYFIRIKQSYHIHHCEDITVNFNESKKNGVYKRDHSTERLNKWGYYLSDNDKEKILLNISIKYSPDKNHKSTKIISTKLSSLTLGGFANGENIIENSKIDNIYLDKFSSGSNTTFYNIETFRNIDNSKFELKKSNLNNIWFDNVYFDSWKLISFYRTNFGNTTFTSCNFPNNFQDFDKFKTIENVHYPDKKTNNYFKNRYEVFLQLKNKLDQSGNFQESQKFKSISNEALRRVEDISLWDKFILKINHFSNNHGLSIKRPLALLLILTIVMYIFYLLSIGKIFNSNHIDFNLLGYYFKFLDITHNSTFLVEKDALNGWSIFIDYMNKIIVGFFIYQFIAAFRKYGKH